MNTRNIGGSLLPSGGPEVYRSKRGAHGDFETRPLPDLDTHGLFYAPRGHVFSLIAMHPNGHSCDELAKRILATWETAAADADLFRGLDLPNGVYRCPMTLDLFEESRA